jgi:hypothetical protein
VQLTGLLESPIRLLFSAFVTDLSRDSKKGQRRAWTTREQLPRYWNSCHCLCTLATTTTAPRRRVIEDEIMMTLPGIERIAEQVDDRLADLLRRTSPGWRHRWKREASIELLGRLENKQRCVWALTPEPAGSKCF